MCNPCKSTLACTVALVGVTVDIAQIGSILKDA